jgi:hypothetical protein
VRGVEKRGGWCGTDSIEVQLGARESDEVREEEDRSKKTGQLRLLSPATPTTVLPIAA